MATGVRYELWLKGQDAIRRCSARGDAQVLLFQPTGSPGCVLVDPCVSQATMVIRSCAEEMGKLDSVAGKAAEELFGLTKIGGERSEVLFYFFFSVVRWSKSIWKPLLHSSSSCNRSAKSNCCRLQLKGDLGTPVFFFVKSPGCSGESLQDADGKGGI